MSEDDDTGYGPHGCAREGCAESTSAAFHQRPAEGVPFYVKLIGPSDSIQGFTSASFCSLECAQAYLDTIEESDDGSD